MGHNLQLYSQSSMSWNSPYVFRVDKYVLVLCQTFFCYVFVQKNKHSFSNNNADKRKIFHFPYISTIHREGKSLIRTDCMLKYSCAIVLDISRAGLHTKG